MHLELYFDKDFRYDDMSQQIEAYVKEVVNKSKLSEYAPATIKKIEQRFRRSMESFNENLKYAGYSILLFQKRMTSEERELFVTTEL